MNLVEERFLFGSVTLLVSRPSDPGDLVDTERFETDEYMPYWAELWPSGVTLARHVSMLDLRGQRVLELGCGLGLPSLVAAAAGADVTATDWAPEAVERLLETAEINGIVLTGAVLDWRDPAALERRSFDLVVASDVLYEERNAAPLLGVLDISLAPAGRAIVADPGRRHAEGFPALAADAGFTTASLPPDATSGPVTLLELRRALAS
jgi:predicted nicotinamide N-methyase